MKLSSREKEDEYYLFNSITNNYTINYVTDEDEDDVGNKVSEFTGVSNEGGDYYRWKNDDTYPIFLSECSSITIPRRIKRDLERLPKNILKKIDQEKSVAVEKCLISVSNLTPTIFKDNKWKSLSSKVLHEQTKRGNDNTYIYKHIIRALEYHTNSTLPIIECKKNSYNTDTYEKGIIAKQYKFSSHYEFSNVVKYNLKDGDSIKKRTRYLYSKLNRASKNPIGKNLISLYGRIELPTENEILIEGRRLVKEGYRTKKGKLLTYLNKRSKDYFSDFESRSFIEENLKQFKYLTSSGYMIPNIGDIKSGGRVVDSFNLMPSWIRQMCLIDNEEIVELDYSAFHPNIALSIFEGNTQFLTHQQVAKDLDKNVQEVKIEHLSFFNKHPNEMKKSILYRYYSSKEPLMLNRIIQDKHRNNYKNTSKLLFNKEVEIMTECIKALNKRNVYVIYVYDALYCKKSDKNIVKEILNKAVIDNGVFTQVK
ncbi:hypothetical protein [Cellulophaga baltica]|uniref:Uncharacterized protein n=1 Tax=Cellulophaga baltica 18 TaxID=1348584 RepID=A0AAU8RK91_9FLAO|nr:hypothetical protein [Cellulophaga baltica]AIZ41223.1 hypothetical protein M666_06340 [Cellulophaga baltica 18]